MDLSKTVLVLLIFLFSVGHVFSYNIRPTPGEIVYKLMEIDDLFVIKEDNSDLYVDVTARLWINSGRVAYKDNISILFLPVELSLNPPIEELGVIICEIGFTNGDFYSRYSICENEIPFTVEKKPYNRSYSDEEYNLYYITVDVFEDFPSNLYMRLNFTLKNHIIKKGDYYLLYLNYPGSVRALHKVTFSSTATPYKMPENSKLDTFTRIDLRTEPIFLMNFRTSSDEGRSTDILWYYDEVEREQELIQLQEEFTDKGVKKGAIVGGVVSLFVSLSVALLILLFGDRIKERYIPLFIRPLIKNRFRGRRTPNRKKERKYRYTYKPR